MPNLGVLDLRPNDLSGPIPPELEMAPLVSLELWGNEFSGCIPEGLRDIRANDLAHLGLPYCE